MKVKVELGNKTANPSNLVAIFSALSQSMDVVGLSPKIITAYIPLYNADGVLAEPIDKSGRVMNYLFRDKKFQENFHKKTRAWMYWVQKRNKQRWSRRIHSTCCCNWRGIVS